MIVSDSRSSSSIPVRYYFISLLLPLSVLLVLRTVPQIDLNFNDPAAHFYIVTAISFSGIILAGLANSLSRVSGRAQVLFVSLGLFSVAGLPDVWADRELINRVSNNLLGNAITHTPPGGQVVLNAEADPDGNLIVRVKDQGEGISPEDQAHIFEKFARIGGESSADGIGLGLAFCRLAVEQHQGRIWVESEPGQSSTFSFTLPTLTTATAI